LKDAGVSVTPALPMGGHPSLDPQNHEPDFQTEGTHGFDDDQTAQNQLSKTAKFAYMNVKDFDAVFFPGGHGSL